VPTRVTNKTRNERGGREKRNRNEDKHEDLSQTYPSIGWQLWRAASHMAQLSMGPLVVPEVPSRQEVQDRKALQVAEVPILMGRPVAHTRQKITVAIEVPVTMVLTVVHCHQEIGPILDLLHRLIPSAKPQVGEDHPAIPKLKDRLRIHDL
jgi:hypothetical protein